MIYAIPNGVTTYPQGDPDADYKLALLCQATTSRQWDFKGEVWTCHDSGRGGGYYHIQPPNRKACNAAGYDTLIGASSYHPGGVNLLLLDGSVKFAKNGIAIRTWHALGTIARWRADPGRHLRQLSRTDDPRADRPDHLREDVPDPSRGVLLATP